MITFVDQVGEYQIILANQLIQIATDNLKNVFFKSWKPISLTEYVIEVFQLYTYL